MRIAALLAPGAGGTADHPTLVAIERALGAGAVVERLALPSGSGARATRAVASAAEALAARAGLPDARVVLGGRSYGGRMCSMAVAEGTPARALVLVSYPLHPPGRKADLRTAHFGRLSVPCLFVSGTRDPFAAPAELEEAAQGIAGAVTTVWVDGAGHGLRGHDAEVAEAVRAWLDGLPG